jgi:hypothetical protein
MDMDQLLFLGRRAYDAYNDARGGVAYDGSPIPPWDQVNEGIQQGWARGAQAIVNTLIEGGANLDRVTLPPPPPPIPL